ncbi:hypothetical protein EDD18DRAFT_1464901 [Armillaria luteobubalina]|uniref:Uncharacterized protein n=1 Tax=Armillaria luteobubalina TaxID=153913 RepID=A0AA39Q0A2_9AGAR|nr:hypothetical protein EDD18DRAFT_1464901 [Armillaria luteobubalina]
MCSPCVNTPKRMVFQLQPTARLLSHSNNRHYPYPSIMKNIGRLLGKKSIETAIVPLEILKAASEAIPVPALAPATEILLSILNLAYQTQENADTRKEIVTRCVRAHVAISRRLGNMEITTNVLENIEQFERDLKDVRDFIEKENRKNRLNLLFYSKSKKDDLQRLGTQFEDTLRLFQINTMLSLHEAIGCVATRLQHVEHNVVGFTKSIASFPIPTTEVGCDSTGIPTVSMIHIATRKQIYGGRNLAFHTAEMEGRCVVMKVFKGSNARLNWQKSNAFDRTVANPHIPRLIAISSVDDPVHFSVYDFYAAVSLENFILSSVRQGLRETFECGVKLVYGISTGLDHLSEQGVSLADINADEVHIFWDTNGRAIVTMDSDLLNKPRVISPFTGDTVSRSLAVLDSVLSRIFRRITHFLYEDNLDRSGGNEDNSIYLQAFQTEATDTQMETEADEMRNTTRQPSTSGGLQSTTPAVKPRRELVWKASVGHMTSVQEVAQQYQRLVDLHSQSSLLHRYRNLSTPQTYHRCKGYSREEVTLTHTAFDSKIVVHATPSVHEVCLVCGERIAEDLPSIPRFKCHCKKLDDGVSPNIQCTECFTWQHEHCSIGLRNGQADHACMDCQLRNERKLLLQRVLDLSPGAIERMLRSGPSNILTHQGFDEPITARITESGPVSSPQESSSTEKKFVDRVSYPGIHNQEEMPHILSPELSMKGDRGDEGAAHIRLSAGTNRSSNDTGREKISYRTEINNLCVRLGWTLRFIDELTGPKDSRNCTSVAYVNGVMRGQASAPNVVAAREQASYLALRYYDCV